MMKKHVLTFTPKSYYVVMLFSALLIFLYLLRVIFILSAVVGHQRYTAIVSQRDLAALTEGQHRSAAAALERAVRYDGNDAKYAYELGSYLHRYYAESSSPDSNERDMGFQDADTWLRKAVMLDPGNPWYYYEFGRLRQSQGTCRPPYHLEDVERCPSAHYFSLALRHAPGNLFLRRSVGLWFYQRDQKKTFQLIQEILSGSIQDAQQLSLEFSTFLYDMGLDYASDLKYPSAAPQDAASEACRQGQPIASPSEQTVREFGSDDGSSEWRAYLDTETQRVKKILCVPDNLESYSSAALKIFMNHGGSEQFVAHISINEHVIATYDHNIPRKRQWYEIPFDISLLRGQSHINVYIRVSGASYSGRNYLQIWADQDTPTTHSSFKFHETHDLSDDKGIQTGEYMIRLVLRTF